MEEKEQQKRNESIREAKQFSGSERRECPELGFSPAKQATKFFARAPQVQILRLKFIIQVARLQAQAQ